MAYIGRGLDKISNVEKLDNLTFDGSSTSFALQKGGSSFVPSSANNILLSIDGVVQAGNFTVSGSTIDFGTAISGSSTCDFILHYGVGVITTPADGTVTTAKLADSSVTTAKLNDASVSLAKLTATGTKDATTFLRGDNSFAEVVSGLTVADQWHTNANQSGTFFTLVNWERLDYGTTLPLGTGMTESSGVFTFPSTGYYRVFCHAAMTWSTASYYAGIELLGTNNNSSYVRIAESLSNIPSTISAAANASCETIFKVTNTSNDKIKMNAQAVATTTYVGNANFAATSITFIKLGEI